MDQVIHLLRAMDFTTDYKLSFGQFFGQQPYMSPSVFNFYSPDYRKFIFAVGSARRQIRARRTVRAGGTELVSAMGAEAVGKIAGYNLVAPVRSKSAPLAHRYFREGGRLIPVKARAV